MLVIARRKSMKTRSTSARQTRDRHFVTSDKLGELKDGHMTMSSILALIRPPSRSSFRSSRGRLAKPCAVRRQIRTAVVSQVGRVHYGGMSCDWHPWFRPIRGHDQHPGDGRDPAWQQDQHHRRGLGRWTMHVIRDLCQGVPGVMVFAGDLTTNAWRCEEDGAAAGDKNKLSLRTYIRQRQAEGPA